uniref:Uncharacterized protein n=1 Tax=Heterorhabditis bacteriophora TaxID=37862 RepID=A0A1I7WX15_HETBA
MRSPLFVQKPQHYSSGKSQCTLMVSWDQLAKDKFTGGFFFKYFQGFLESGPLPQSSFSTSPSGRVWDNSERF